MFIDCVIRYAANLVAFFESQRRNFFHNQIPPPPGFGALLLQLQSIVGDLVHTLASERNEQLLDPQYYRYADLIFLHYKSILEDMQRGASWIKMQLKERETSAGRLERYLLQVIVTEKYPTYPQDCLRCIQQFISREDGWIPDRGNIHQWIEQEADYVFANWNNIIRWNNIIDIIDE